jgi:superfamily I DNA/RNA helicase
VTFTRTAAQDLKHEIHAVGVPGANEVLAKTLHSYCFGLLNSRDIIESTGRHPRPVLDFEQKPMLYDLGSGFGNIRDKQRRLKAFEAAWARLQSEEPGYPTNETDRLFAQGIQRWLLLHQAMLFGEMIIETYHYLNNNPAAVERNLFDHILVDEYQDLNKAEQSVIDLLSSNCALAIIGDDDQSIYSFKHAHPEGIRDFSQAHPNCEAIAFDQCRRCPKRAVSMASRLIDHNLNRTLGNLREFDSNQDGIVEIIQWQTLDDEINGICERVSRELTVGMISPEDILILTPVRRIGYRIRDALVSAGVNAKSYFREEALGTDALKYSFSLLTLLASPDDAVALRYLLGAGNQTFRTKSYQLLLVHAEANRLPVTEVLRQIAGGQIRIQGVTALVRRYAAIIEQLSNLRNTIEQDRDSLIDALADDCEDNRTFRSLFSDALAAIENPEEVTLSDWLQEVYSGIVERISFPENTSQPDHVRIMSLHASKGLSAKYVVIMSAIDELLPRIDTDEPDLAGKIEEQRRLFYVAITRCKSSNNGYPGTLIISSFTHLPGSEALQMGIKASANARRAVSATRFMRDFENTAPPATTPHNQQ